MATIQGIPNPTAGEYIEVSRAYDNNGSGRVIQLVFRGDKNTLRIASAQWVALGAKYSIREDGPYSEATVTIGGNSFDPGLPIQDQTTPQVGELADIRYEFRTDYLDVSVFALPAVDKEANSTGNPALYRYIIETAIKNGERLPGIQESNISTLPLAQKVWQMLYRGQDTFPTARVSLTRIATFSGNLGLPQVPNGIPPVYTRESFATAWNLPFSVVSMLPTTPIDQTTGQALAPVGTAWGWKQTNYSTSLITKTNQVEQVIAWTFAPYDTLVYPFF
ncbi:MAG: hypothetical protein LW834_01540 [Cyanobium sp. 49614_E6]|jgi:hypothetical protein|nr:hypothetical protein [Cyanobium sp. 49614_E6]